MSDRPTTAERLRELIGKATQGKWFVDDDVRVLAEDERRTIVLSEHGICEMHEHRLADEIRTGRTP